MSSKRKITSLLNEYVTKISSLPFITKDGEKSIVENTYICPLCLQSFKVDDLKTITDYLSLEDIPQKAMGGHPLLLTCKKCNNRCGHEIDHFLQTEIDHEDEVSIHSEKGVRGTLTTKGITINTMIRKKENGIMICNILSRQNSPIELYKFNEEIEKLGENWRKSVRYQVEEKNRNPIRADIAILKSAYLLAFYMLGYKYIFNSNLSPVREQIFCPEKEIISNYIINRGSGLPLELTDGVYVAEFREKRFLAVIISIKMKESKKMHRYAVALPYFGVDEDIYNVIKDADDESCNFTLLGFAQIKDWSVSLFPQKGRRYLVY